MDIIFNSVGFILTVIGTILSVIGIFLTVRGNKKKVPVYSIKSNNIISGSKSKYENLRVLYGRNQVENFTVSKILFYNRGSDTLTRKDIETSYPLRVSTKGCQLLDASVLQVNKPSNKFTLLWDESGEFFYIDFDYLDKNQGGVIQLVHTGLSSDNLTVEGDIIGVQGIDRIPSNRYYGKSKVENKRKVNALLLLYSVLTIASPFLCLWLNHLWTLAVMWNLRSPSFSNGTPELLWNFLNWFPLFFMLILFIIVIYLWLRTYNILIGERPSFLFPSSNQVPDGLEKFLE